MLHSQLCLQYTDALCVSTAFYIDLIRESIIIIKQSQCTAERVATFLSIYIFISF